MVAATARRAVFPRSALLALPHTASAAFKWRSCVDFRDVQLRSLDVPLDRAGVDPGRVKLRIARIGPHLPAGR